MKKYISSPIIVAFILLFTFSTSAQGIARKITINNDLEIVQLTPNVYLHVSYAEFTGFGRGASNGMILTDGDKAFLFDTPPTEQLTQQLVDWIMQTMKLKLVGFIPNHWHNDCMGGLGYLQSIGIESYANQMTIDIAKTKNLPVPSHGFKDSLNLKLGNVEFNCYYPGQVIRWIILWCGSLRRKCFLLVVL